MSTVTTVTTGNTTVSSGVGTNCTQTIGGVSASGLRAGQAAVDNTNVGTAILVCH